MQHSAFYISDGTAITAEVVGHAILSQFPLEFTHTTVPFVENLSLAEQVKEQINSCYKTTGTAPFIFYTFVDLQIMDVIQKSAGICFDVLNPFTSQVAAVTGVKPEAKLHRTHSINVNSYDFRIDAINYALANDDGVTTQNYQDADVILVGVSRSGKTPTSLYLAMQYGIKAANYPFINEDMDNLKLPPEMKQYKNKIFGLTIDANRLSAIRNERLANSRYASIRQCRMELKEVELLYRKEKLPFINSTHYSVEEISARIISDMKLERHKY
ncbi:MAG: kinase/pyrophosphorylase [Gammaproteobacteria bacterium]|nr:kinase/pyrophosphorylase [Gammaproteobacteria bacterium]